MEEIQLQHQALYEQIADKLEFMILNDHSKLDTKLPSEHFLSDMFGVSRPVIREAIKLLKERGLIQSRQGAASVISAPDEETLSKNMNRIVRTQEIAPEQVYQLRIVLETFSASLAAQNAQEEQLKPLRRLLDKEASCQNVEEIVETDLNIHREIASASGNLLLEMMLSSILTILKPVITRLKENPVLIDDGAQFHKKIYQAIKNKDSQAASELMQAHLVMSARNYEYMEGFDGENF